MALLEICCYSMECALTAQKNGADRIELCSAPKEGGLTPSLGVLRTVRQHIDIPVNPIIRRAAGIFAIPTVNSPPCWMISPWSEISDSPGW